MSHITTIFDMFYSDDFSSIKFHSHRLSISPSIISTDFHISKYFSSSEGDSPSCSPIDGQISIITYFRIDNEIVSAEVIEAYSCCIIALKFAVFHGHICCLTSCETIKFILSQYRSSYTYIFGTTLSTYSC